LAQALRGARAAAAIRAHRAELGQPTRRPSSAMSVSARPGALPARTFI
jgi:hypothetical protein